MDKILEYIMTHMPFLYKEMEFRITHSNHIYDYAGGIILKKENIRLHFSNERDQLFLYITNTQLLNLDKWNYYSTDLMSTLLYKKLIEKKGEKKGTVIEINIPKI